MSGLDDFLKGINAFNQGLSEFAISSAVTDANKQMREINSMQMEQAEKEAAQNELSNTLALRLTQAGANASQVQTTAGRLGMSEPQQRELDFRRGQMQTSAMLSAEESRLDSKKESAKLLDKDAERRANALAKAQDKFEALPGVKKFKEAAEKADNALALLNANNPVADQGIKTIMAKASGEVGNLTESEREQFAGSPAVFRRISRVITKYKDGVLTDADREDIKILAKLMKQSAVRSLNKATVSFAKGRSQALKNIGINETEILETISPEVSELQNKIKAGEELLNRLPPNHPKRRDAEIRLMQLKRSL